jgi:hypothetical protein
MSKIIYNDLIRKYQTSITHTEDDPSDSFTAITSVDKVANRSLLDSYRFTATGAIFSPSAHTITINLSSDMETMSAFAIMNYSYLRFSISSFTLKDLNGFEITRSNEVETTQVRYVNGVRRETNVYTFDAISTVREIEIEFINTEPSPSDEQFEIGRFYAGQAIDINIKPSSLNYSFKALGEKVRTDYGQVYANENNSYMLAKFTSTATKESTVVSDYFNLNYISANSDPIIFIPQETEDILLYGTQEKTNVTKCLMAKDDNEWTYETSFQLEEEF